MIEIRAFDGYIVQPERASRAVSPAYDSLTPGERHAFGLAHPHNYINVMRSSDEYPECGRPTHEEVLQVNADNLRMMLDGGNFEAIETPSVFVYRLRVNGHEQTAVVCEIPMGHYDDGRVLKHENTRSDKEDQLTNYLDVVGASSSPVCLAYQENPNISRLVDSITGSEPLIKFSVHDDVVQTLWKVDDEESIRRFTDLFCSVDRLYLTDGHHRFAAGSRFTRQRRLQNPNHSGSESYNYVLVALFSANQLRILPFNRCVRDLNGLSADQLLKKLTDTFTVEKVDSSNATPGQRHEFGMFLEGNWYKMQPRAIPNCADHPVEALDVTILQNRILSPILGITDARSDARLDYVTGDSGVKGLEQRCGDGWAVSFACYPTSIDELMQVADSGEVMPPKSTYFDPKVRSGIFLRLY